MRNIAIRYWLLIALGVIPFLLAAQSKYKKQYFDGPYIFHQNDSLRMQWVEAGVPHDSIIANREATIFKRKGLPVIDLTDLSIQQRESETYSGVEKIVALSDVHGQYDILIKLLKNNGVVDDKLQWTYGKGHLVIVGDNMDRGDKVLDILWLLFRLEKQATQQGGQVHTLVGNHETMVLSGDVRYIHKKYYYTAGVLKTQYKDLWRKGSVLGDWIANQPILTSINKHLFVHGGVSPEILKLNYSVEKINEIFRKRIMRKKDTQIYHDQLLNQLALSSGPLWYRGYFDSTRMNLPTVNYILKKTGQDKIVVGHTSLDEISSMYNNKILAVDCSIKKGKTGQVLIIEKDKYRVGGIDGKRSKLGKIKKPVNPSLYEYLYNQQGRPKIILNTQINRLIRKSSKEEYQAASLQFFDAAGNELFAMDGRIRARGNMRKQVCVNPPVKIDFGKGALDSLGFLRQDKLKMVFPCSGGSLNQQMLLKEHLVYELYNFIDTNSMRTKLVDVEIFDKGKKKQDFIGILVEDEQEYARRNKAIVIEKGKLRSSRLDREVFVKMEFFQYMIANTDWSVGNKHNLELVKLPNFDKIRAVPYDFDYSGFVGQDYAVPAPNLPIEDVNERYFFNYEMTEAEFKMAYDYFMSIEKDLYIICSRATYMKQRAIRENIDYIKSFYQELKEPKRFRKMAAKKFKKK
ncbi:MAG: metallophosphoesterase [Bacteroidota bacterium]